MRCHVLAVGLSALMTLVEWRSAGAQWASNGVRLCAPGTAQSRTQPVLVADGVGGTIIAWQEYHAGSNYDIYAQRVNRAGVRQWDSTGVALCSHASAQVNPIIVSDGSGGAIVAWEDQRSGVSQIYAQRVSVTGSRLWTADGVQVCTSTPEQIHPAITSDGNHGAIVSWADARPGGLAYDIYAQHLNAGNGSLAWVASGQAICRQTNVQDHPAIISDGNTGAIIAWADGRSFQNVYAQHVDGSGSVQWMTDGVAVFSTPSVDGDVNQSHAMVSDGANGAIIGWEYYNRGANPGIYAQRLSAVGAPVWNPNGVSLCIEADCNSAPGHLAMISDGAHGIIAAWNDIFSVTDIVFASRLDANGNPLWTGCSCNSVLIGGGPHSGDSGDDPAIATDRSEGAIIVWPQRTGDANPYDISGQRVSWNGGTSWFSGPLCTAPNDQDHPVVVSDGIAGAVVAWQDQRSGAYDIYVQHVYSNGSADSDPAMTPTLPRARVLPNPFADHVSIRFGVSSPTIVRLEVFDIAGHRVWRSEPRVLDRGDQGLAWDGRAADGGAIANGIYLLEVRGPGVEISRAVVHIK